MPRGIPWVELVCPSCGDITSVLPGGSAWCPRGRCQGVQMVPREKVSA